jgi:hypothetical protein
MKQFRTSTLRWLGILGCVMLMAGWIYAQTAGSPNGVAAKPAAQNTRPVVNSATAEHPAAAPAPAPSSAPAQDQSAPEVALCGIDVDPKDPKALPQSDCDDPKAAAKETEVALGKFVILKFDTPWEKILKQQKTPANKLGLFINDLFMKGLEPMGIPEHPNWVMFQLERNGDNQEAWGVLFGRKKFFDSKKNKSEDEKLRLTIGLQDGSWGAKNPQVVYLEYAPDWTSWLVLVISGIVAALTICLGVMSSMLRDSGDPRTDGKKGTYSLGRFQMALWFVTVVFAFLFTYAITGDTSPIPQGTLILMGIGAGTALGAAAIDLNKRTASKTDLINWTAEKVNLPQQIQNLQTQIASTAAGDPNLPPLQQQLLTAQQRLSAISAQLAQIPTTQVQASEGFIRDLLSDENGISLHRLQVFGWTLVFWAVFVSMLFKKVTMVDFDTTQLALMGISGSTYLGFKLQEKQS